MEAVDGDGLRRRDAAAVAATGAMVPRKTVALPSILGPYQAPANLLPKPTPVNLRRFAETPRGARGRLT